MRNIKFRAWDKKVKKMYGVTCIDFACWDLYLDSPGRKYGNAKKIAIENLMQFTGLFDKNGKEIYEGDIVNYSGYGFTETFQMFIGEVYWSNHRTSFSIKNGDIHLNPIYPIEEDKVKIVGNIYENPELLSPQ